MDVAWLALAVAVLSLAWQVVDARRRRRTNVSVQVHHLAVPASIEDGPELLGIPALGLYDRPVLWPAGSGEQLTYVLAVVALNGGETTEYVADLRVVDLGNVGAGADDGAGARELAPRGRVTWAFRPDRLRFDPSRGFFAEALLASGQVVRSGPHTLDADLLDAIAESRHAPSGDE